MRLKQIVLPEVVFDGLPLPEVAKMLTSDAKKHDPNKQGVQIESGTLSSTIGSVKLMKNATLDDVLKADHQGNESGHRLPGARGQGCVHGCRCEGRAGPAKI